MQGPWHAYFFFLFSCACGKQRNHPLSAHTLFVSAVRGPVCASNSQPDPRIVVGMGKKKAVSPAEFAAPQAAAPPAAAPPPIGRALSRQLSRSVQDATTPKKKILIIGQIGDGKSTLVNGLRDKDNSDEAAAKNAAKGVTKTVAEYQGKPINGTPTLILDTPGIGDHDVDLISLVGMVENHLGQSPVDVVIVTQDLSQEEGLEMGPGAKLVRILVEKGFLGGAERWKKVILCGTKRDIAEEETIANFKEQIVYEFFEPLGSVGPYCMIDKTENGLLELLERLKKVFPKKELQYKPPETEVLVTEMAKAFNNVSSSAAEEKFRDMRLRPKEHEYKNTVLQFMRNDARFAQEYGKDPDALDTKDAVFAILGRQKRGNVLTATYNPQFYLLFQNGELHHWEIEKRVLARYLWGVRDAKFFRRVDPESDLLPPSPPSALPSLPHPPSCQVRQHDDRGATQSDREGRGQQNNAHHPSD